MPDIKDKIAKLLALAESPNEHEAKAAMLKARALMAEHKLSERDIQRTNGSKLTKETIGIVFTELSQPWTLPIANVIAKHYCCAAFQSVRKGAKQKSLGLIGIEDDWKICAQVCRYALGYVKTGCEQIKAENRRCMDSKQIRQAMKAYGYGFCVGLQESFKIQDEEHQEWGLVLTVPKEVQDTVKNMQKVNRKSPELDQEQRQYLARGYSDGLKFELHGSLKA